MALKLIGYWCSPDARAWPHPRRLVSRWEPSLRRQMVDYLRSGRTCATYRGFSFCRFGCGENGGIEQTDGIFAWPDGLAHYVEAHSVRLPAALVEYASAQRFVIPVGAPYDDSKPHQEPYDLTFWAEWCRREAPPRWIDSWRVAIDKYFYRRRQSPQ